MIVRELCCRDFRNLHAERLCPAPGVNILYGDNAQGKTNLLEACWLFTGARSFRGAKDSELVSFDADEARLTMNFFAGEREQQAEIRIRQRRSVTLNGVRLPSAAKLAGHLCGVVFSPAHLSLIRDGPEGRRHFTDAAYCQLRPGYIGALAEFRQVLAQRNAFLRQAAEQKLSVSRQHDMLPLWDHTLAAAGARITAARLRYIRRLEPLAAEIYAGLSGGREKLTLRWQTEAFSPEEWDQTEEPSPVRIAEAWLAVLNAADKADLAAGFSTVGPHREDMPLLLDGAPARSFGSQGQQRSIVLALKLAEAALLQQTTGEPPVAFLDDVMSELDVTRQDYILNHIHDWQVFITCCEPTTALRMTAGEVFHIQQGVIQK